MGSKLSIKEALCLLGIVVIVSTVSFTIPRPPLTLPIGASVLVIKNPSPGRPLRLIIPKINVNAAVEEVGMTPGGAMDVPRNPEDTAWFGLGSIPGGIGSSVIDGHSGWKNNKPAVFDTLDALAKGDKIYVKDINGEVTTFVVRELRSYDPGDKATDVFSSNDGISHLNLITCSGAWNETERTHSKRLIVFTDRK